MKAVILAGGLGTRISEESILRPKPMISIGGIPILRHVMQIYLEHGINEFIICLGYKGYVIKEYFSNYLLHTANVVEIDLGKKITSLQHLSITPIKVILVETGENTQTGGRIKKILPFVCNDPFFYLTYGDGVGNIDITNLTKHHLRHNKLATVTSVAPPSRFGNLSIENNLVTNFEEKPLDSSHRINGGFFVLSPDIANYIDGNETVWEQEPLRQLTHEKQLTSFEHNGFWQPMDTMRDKSLLEDLWRSGDSPWWNVDRP